MIKSANMIAILMATYNGENFISQQLDSIVSQSFCDWELFIRDDGSTDNTIAIIKEYENTYPNIHYIEDDLGSLGTRDQFLHLMKIVDAEYYMFCDQDDKWFEDKIEKSLIKIKLTESNNPNKAILIGSDCAICGSNLEVVNPSCWDHLRINPSDFLNIDGIFVYPFITGASMILNNKVKEVLPPIPVGLPRNRPMYDWWILINVYRSGVVDLLDEPTRYYRQHSNNISGGLDKLDTSYMSKLINIRKSLKANKTRSHVLKELGYNPLKYYFYKMIYLNKMINYHHKNNQ